MAPDLSLRGGRRPTWQSREGSHVFADSFPAIRPGPARLPRRFAPRNDTSGGAAIHQRSPAVECPCTGRSMSAATDAIGLYGLSLPCTSRKCLPEIATAPLGPRNDTSGECRGAPAPSSGLIPLCKALNERRYGRNRLVRFCRQPIRVGGIAPGAACRSPTTHDRRSSYYSFFSLQYSLFIISSIPLRGMANHMTKRPEIPCLSCKFPQSRRICH